MQVKQLVRSLALDFDLILPQHKALKEHLKGYMSEELENLGI